MKCVDLSVDRRVGELCAGQYDLDNIRKEVNNAIKRERMVSFFNVSFNWFFTPVYFEDVYGFRTYDVDTLMIIVLWTFFLQAKKRLPSLWLRRANWRKTKL